MGVRNRLSGTLSIQNRYDQLRAAWRFWTPIILAMTGAVYGAGLYYLCAKRYNFSSVLFYVQFKVDDAYHLATQLNQQSDRTHAFSQSFYLWLTGVVSPTKALTNFYANGGTDKELISMIQDIGSFIHSLHMVTLCTFTAMTLLAFAIARWEARRQTEDKYIKGSRLFPVRILNKLLRKQYGEGTLKIGKLILPKKMENLSLILIGKPQMGKTVLFNNILSEIQRRNEPAIIFCAKKEDFVTTHYREGIDQIFCPPDIRSLSWSLKNDIKSVEDFAVLANVLAPPNPQAKEAMWQKGELLTIKALFRHWWLATDRSNKELARIAKLSQAEMAQILSETPGAEDAYGLIGNTKSQTAYSFYVSILCDLQPLQLLAQNDGSFSINEFLRTGKHCIFLPCSDRLEASLSPLYGMFMELMAINHLDLPQDRLRRVWYLVDELPAISITKLPSLLNRGPSYGVCAVLGTQSIIQLDTRCGEPNRRAIMNACATTVVYCIEDDKTAEELSKRIGSDEKERAKENLSTASAETRDGVTVMAEIKKEALISSDELRDLPPLTCYVRVAGFGTAEKMKLKYKDFKIISPDFVQNPIYSLEAIENEYTRTKAEAQTAKDKYMANMVNRSVEDKNKKESVSLKKSQDQEQQQQEAADEQMNQMLIDSDEGRTP